MNNKKRFYTNMSSALLSQIIILCISMIVSFILPKMISIKDYSLWQLFVFYSSYTGIFLLGINDGFIVHNGGKEYHEFDKCELTAELIITFLLEIFIALILGLSILVFKPRRFYIFVGLIFYMIFQNIFSFVGGIHQSANNNKTYAYACIVERLIFVGLLLISMIFKNQQYYLYIIFNLISVFASLIVILRCTQLKFPNNKILFKTAIKNVIVNFNIGIKVMIANLSGTLIIGIGRILIERNWNIIVFGQVSLAISIVQLFLTFITKASIVLFPAIKQLNKEKANHVFKLLYLVITFLGPLILILFFPIKYIICLWLPNYKQSMIYLAFLLPISIFDSKMNLVYSTFLKMNRDENKLLLYNLISCFICFIFGLISVSLKMSIYCLLMIILFTLMIREFIVGTYVLQKIGVNMKFMLLEFISIMSFVYLALNVSTLYAVALFSSMYVFIIVILKKDLLKFYKGDVKR